MYLVHYVYVTWTHKPLLGIPIHASIKFVIAFLTVTLLSWLSAQFLLRVLSATAFPTAYIVGADGQIVFRHSGALNWDDDRARAFLLSLAAHASVAN